MSIALCGRYHAMPHELLQHPDVRAALQHMRRGAMANLMRRDPALHPGLYRHSFKFPPESAPVYRLTLGGQEQCGRSYRKPLSPHRQVRQNRIFRFLAEWDDTLLVALSTYTHLARLKVNHRQGKAKQLRDTHPGRIHEFQHRPITDLMEFRPCGRIKKAPHVVDA